MKYYNYEDIPKDMKKVIRERMGLTRITELTIEEINRISNDCEEELKMLEALKVFSVISNTGPDGKAEEHTFKDLEEVHVHLDRLTNYDDGSELQIIFKQAERVVKTYYNGQWIFP